MDGAALPRPRSAAEIVDVAVRLVRQHYGPMIALTALFMVPFSVVERLSFPALAAASFTVLQAGRTGALPQLAPLPMYAWGLASIVWYAGTTAVVLTLAAADAYAGHDIALRKDLMATIRRLPSVIALVILGIILFNLAAIVVGVPITIFSYLLATLFLPSSIAGIVGIVAASLLIVAGMGYMAAALLPSLPVLLLEDVGPRVALRRSAQLTKGLRGHALAVYGLMYLLLAVVVIGISIMVRAVGNPVLATIVLIAEGITVAPFAIVPSTVLYYDLRVRKEGYDIQAMAGTLDGVDLPSTGTA